MNFINKAELKVTEDGFNSMPDRATIEAVIAEYGLEVVDIDSALKEYWQNAEDTVVAMMPENVQAYDATVVISKLHQMSADEVDTIKKDGRIIIRMWWD